MSYIYLDRDIASHPLWSDKPFARGQAWVDLILQARFVDSQAYIRGIRIDLKRGELALSQEILANRWGWSRGKVARFLDDMQSNSEIDRRQYNRIDIITICKYEEYQTKKATDGTTDGQRKGGRRAADGAHNKEGKKGKECNGDFILPDWVPKEEWEAWQETRIKAKATQTTRALQLAVNELEALVKQGYDPRKVLNRSIMSGWKSLNPKPEDRAQTPKSGFMAAQGLG